MSQTENPNQVIVPPRPRGSFRVTLSLTTPAPRLDAVLIEALRKQDRSIDLNNLSRAKIKELFSKKKIRIKGQAATPSSAVARGITYVDILGYSDPTDPAL
jgi:hypothetical protein